MAVTYPRRGRLRLMTASFKEMTGSLSWSFSKQELVNLAAG